MLFFIRLLPIHLLVVLLAFILDFGIANANEQQANQQASYQSDLYFDQITLESGLNQGSIFAVTTDHRGFTWIGTQDGLHVFDGNTIQLIKLSNTNIPKYRFIRALKIIKHQLVIATHDGLVLLNLNTGKKQYYTSKVGDVYQIELVENQIWLAGDTGIEVVNEHFKTMFILDSQKDICRNTQNTNANCHGLTRAIVYQPKTNKVWLGTSVGLFSYDTKTQSLSTYVPSNNLDLDKNLEIRTLAIDENATLWIGSDCGLYKKHITDKVLVSVASCKQPQNLLNSINIRTLAIDTANNLWVGSAKGIYWFNLTNNSINSYSIKPQTTNKHDLTNEFIRTLHTDSKGRIWVGTNNGLSVTNIERLKVKSYRAPADSATIGNYTYSFIAAENSHLLYISSEKGLNLVNPKNTSNVIPIINNETIFDTESIGSEMWAGGRGYLYKINQTTNQVTKTFDAANSPLDGRYIYKLLSDKKDNLWLGTSYGLYRYNTKSKVWSYWNIHNGLVDGEIYELHWLNKKLWIGTQNGISVFNLESQTFTNYDHKNSALTSRWVFDINQLNNKVYIATDGGVYEFINNAFQYLPIINGNAYSVLPFSKNKLIITTNTGLKVYDTISKTTLTLTVSNGLASDEFNYNAHYIHQNNIYLGNPTGYTVITEKHLNSLFEYHKATPKLSDANYITQAIIDGQQYGMWEPTPVSKKSLLTTNNVDIDWLNKQTSLMLSNPYFATELNHQYISSAFSLKSRANTYSLNPKIINLNVLSSGNYSLDLHQSKPIKVIKSPHPLTSEWAILLYIVGFILITLLVLRFYYLTKFTKELKNKNTLIKQQHQTINEHLKFKEHIFFQVQHSLKSPISASRGLLYLLEQQIKKNNLDQTSLLRKTYKLKNAQNKLTELVEQILIISSSEHASLIRSIQNIKDTLGNVIPMMEELAFQKNIKLCVNLETLTDEARISTIEMGVFIIFENITSNAIKYSPENSSITLDIKQLNNTLIITLVDEGIGISTEDQKQIFEMFYRGKNSANTHGDGLGLALVKKILDDINGEINIQSRLNKGTRIEIKFDLLVHNKEA